MFSSHTSSILLFRNTRSSYHQVLIFLVALTLILFLCISNVYSAQATLSWDPNSESDLDGYKVYYGNTISGDYDLTLTIDVGNETSHTITGLIEGETYFFAVTAYFSGNESGYSNEVNYAIPTNEIPTNEIIIDNGDTETSFTGSWGQSGGANPWDEDSLWSRDGDTYTWTFTPSMTGNHQVFEWHTEWSSRSSSVPMLIQYDGGTGNITVNQQVNGGQWNSIGTYSFVAGTPYNVTITSQPGPSSTCADAVKFVPFTGNQEPNGVIDTPVGDQTITVGDSVNFTGTGTDPELDLPLTYLWNFGAGSGIPDSTLEDPGQVQFNNTGVFTVTFTITDSLGLSDPTPTPRTITVVDIITNDVDAIPPTIASVSTDSSTQVIVVFSEPVEELSAANALNYGINNGIMVYGALLGSDQKTVTLTTSSHSGGDYVLTANNIEDLASIPNVIAVDTTMDYTFLNQLQITNLNVASGKTYQIDGLQNGARAYIDRKYKYSAVPAELQGSICIKTANGDKRSQAALFLTFDVNQDVTVYVAHDDRITTKPSWLVASFTDTGDNLVTTGTTLSMFASYYSAGTITLGGNQGGRKTNMYTVIIVGQ